MPFAELDAYDCRLTVDGVEVGLMLAVDTETGMKQYNEQFINMLSPQQNTSPFSSQSLPPETDVPVTFDSFAGGAGVAHDEASLSPITYNYSQGIDASWPLRLYLSPERRSMTGLVVAPVKFYVSTLGFFAIAGRFIYEWTVSSADWTQRDDAGAGLAYTDMIEMDDVLYAALGDDGYKYSTNGTTWTTFTDSAEDMHYWAVRSRTAGSVIFGIDSNGLLKSTTNARNTGTAWSAADEVGNTTEITRGMVTVDDNIYVTKDRALYRYSGTATTDLLQFSYLTTQNGRKLFVWNDSAIYAPYGDRLLRYAPLEGEGEGTYAYVFPPRAATGNPETNGQITAITGDTLDMYIAVKNGAGNTYIMKGNPLAGIWHTLAYLGANDCNALIIAGPGEVHADNPALVAGYGAAAVRFILPRAGFDPSTDANYTFDTAVGTIVGPHTAVQAHAFPKFLNRGVLITEACTPARPIVLRYEVDNGSATTLLTATEDGHNDSGVTSQVEFTHIRYNITMDTSDERHSPRLVAASLHCTPNPPRRREWSPVVLVADGLELRDGVVDERQSEQFIRTRLMLAPTVQCQFQDRYGSTYIARVLNVRNLGVRRAKQGGVEKDVSLYQLNIAEIGLVTDASLSAFVWNEDQYDGGKVWR